MNSIEEPEENLDMEVSLDNDDGYQLTITANRHTGNQLSNLKNLPIPTNNQFHDQPSRSYSGPNSPALYYLKYSQTNDKNRPLDFNLTIQKAYSLLKKIEFKRKPELQGCNFNEEITRLFTFLDQQNFPDTSSWFRLAKFCINTGLSLQSLEILNQFVPSESTIYQIKLLCSFCKFSCEIKLKNNIEPEEIFNNINKKHKSRFPECTFSQGSLSDNKSLSKEELINYDARLVSCQLSESEDPHITFELSKIVIGHYQVSDIRSQDDDSSEQRLSNYPVKRASGSSKVKYYSSLILGLKHPKDPSFNPFESRMKTFSELFTEHDSGNFSFQSTNEEGALSRSARLAENGFIRVNNTGCRAQTDQIRCYWCGLEIYESDLDSSISITQEHLIRYPYCPIPYRLKDRTWIAEVLRQSFMSSSKRVHKDIRNESIQRKLSGVFSEDISALMHLQDQQRAPLTSAITLDKFRNCQKIAEMSLDMAHISALEDVFGFSRPFIRTFLAWQLLSGYESESIESLVWNLSDINTMALEKGVNPEILMQKHLDNIPIITTSPKKEFEEQNSKFTINTLQQVENSASDIPKLCFTPVEYSNPLRTKLLDEEIEEDQWASNKVSE